MLIKANKLKNTKAADNFTYQSNAHFDQAIPTANHSITIPQAPVAPVIEIDQAEIEKAIELEKQMLLQKFEADIAEKRRMAEAEIQNRLEEIEINLANIQRRESEIEELLMQEKSKLEAEKAAEWQRIQSMEEQLKNQYQAAILEGFDQGYREGKTNLDTVSNEFEQIIQNFHRSKETILLEIEPQITSIALEAVRKILQRESRLDEKLLSEQVQSAIRKVTIKGGLVELSINPSDTVHQAYLEKILSKMLDKEVRLIFKEDPNVSPGSCIVDTPGGQLNASFSVQIESVKLAFEKYFGHEIPLLESTDDEEEISALAETAEAQIEELPTLEETVEAQIEELPAIEEIAEAEEDPLLEITESIIEPQIEEEILPEIENKIEATMETGENDLAKHPNPMLMETMDCSIVEADENHENAATLVAQQHSEIPENIFNDLVIPNSTADTQEDFSSEALALMEELNSAFNQQVNPSTIDTEINLDDLDAEIESILDVSSDELNASTVDTNTELKITLPEGTSTLFTEELEPEEEILIEDNFTEQEPEKENNDDPALLPDLNLEDLQALFDDDREETITEDDGTDLDMIFEQLKENTSNDLENNKFNEEDLEENEDLGTNMDRSEISSLDLNFDLEAPDDAELDALEESMDALLSEVEGEDTDELEALLGSETMSLNFTDDNEEPEITIKEDLDEEIDLDEEEESLDLTDLGSEEDDEEEESIPKFKDDEDIYTDDDFEESPKKKPVFEEFDEGYDDDYSDGGDPRFPDY